MDIYGRYLQFRFLKWPLITSHPLHTSHHMTSHWKMHYNVLHTSHYITSRHITSHPHYTALKCSTYKYIRHVMMNVSIYRCVVKLYKRVKLWIWLAFSLWLDSWRWRWREREREREMDVYIDVLMYEVQTDVYLCIWCVGVQPIFICVCMCVFMYKYISLHYNTLH